MAIADLVATLRTDLADPESALFSDEVLQRCIHKGVYRLARDLEISPCLMSKILRDVELTRDDLSKLLRK